MYIVPEYEVDKFTSEDYITTSGDDVTTTNGSKLDTNTIDQSGTYSLF